MTWRDLLCRIGIHPEWRTNFYDDTGEEFEYCPNCHKHRRPR